MAPVLFEEGVECRLAQPRDKDRFVVRDQLDVQKAAIAVEDDQQVDRSARKAGQGGHRFGFEDVTGWRPPGIQQFPNAVFADLFAQGHGGNDEGFDVVTTQGFGQGRHNPSDPPQHRCEDAQHNRPPVHGPSVGVYGGPPNSTKV